MTRLFDALLAAHSAWRDIYNLKRHLIDNEIGLRDICQLLPTDFMGAPTDKHSKMADFFRDGKRMGWASKLPVEYIQ
jgi:hypothetical protein